MSLRRTVGLLLIVVLSVATVGCQQKDDTASSLPRPSRAFCRAAANYDKVVALKSTTLARHITLTRAIARTAPKDARRDAEIMWHSLEKLRAGDKSVVDNPKVQAAINHVNRRAGQDCGWYRRQEGI
jgi:hypothetical protein